MSNEVPREHILGADEWNRRRRARYRDPTVTTLHVETSEGVELRVDVAGPGSRWAAAFLDFVIVFFLLLAMLFVLAVARAFDPTRTTQFLIGLYLGGVVLLVLGYFAAFHAFGNGQTPGKRVFGIRVVSIDGQPMRHPGAAGVREQVKALEAECAHQRDLILR